MDWSQFTRKIRILAEMNEIYHSWTSTQGLESWFLKKADLVKGDESRATFKQGDVVLWKWHNCENPLEVTVFEADGKSKFVFSFDANMRVSIALSKEERYTTISLIQTGIPTDDESKYNFHLGCSRAWSTWLFISKLGLNTVLPCTIPSLV